ncbi:MAG: SRPBCC domain-containing protein [Bacteroidia bacterium]
METLKFTTVINAPKAKVWEVLWNDETYRKWTSVFHESSHAVSDWKEGSKIQFLSDDGSGMYGIIEKKVEQEQMIFKHLGELNNGVEDPKNWDGARERYYLTEANGITELVSELDSVEEFKDYFLNVFPKALVLIKQLSEHE